MPDNVQVTFQQSPMDDKCAVVTKFSTSDALRRQTEWEIVREIVRLTAERYVQENYPKLVGLLDQQAIANLAIAESGKMIAEEIKTRPVVLHDRETRTEVYEKGILGGMKRVR